MFTRCWPLLRWACLCALPLMTPTRAYAQSSTISGDLIAYSTIYSIGVEWDIANDADHDARVDVEYKASASGAWQPASPLIRVDDGSRNMLAGSVMFLQPDTSYQVRLILFDPDGGGDVREIAVRTQKLPTPPAGRIFHVIPGSGGGDGSTASPFRGVDAAQAVAQPGDTFLLHAGFYGDRPAFYVPGTSTAYIAWRAAADGQVTFPGIDIYAGHLWFEGLTVRDQQYGTRTDRAPVDVVITRCAFVNNFYNIYLNGGGSGWYIADNTITGATPYLSQSDEGEGIELNGTSGHTVAHNRITNVADGVSTPGTNVDIFGNDIFDTADDGLELDFGLANVRVWRNRIHNAYHNGISFQPQNSGPWYIIRNQIIGSAEAPFKFRSTDRFVLVNNTIVNFAGEMICCGQSHLLRGFLRNNLWISAQGGQIWNFEALSDWRTDIDYDGFDWGDAAYPLVWAGAIYYDLPSFAIASGLESHGVRIVKDRCFADFQVPGPTPTQIPPHLMTLRGDCEAVDAGVLLPNLSDQFTGSAPDLGAYEYGLPSPIFGPRPATSAPLVMITSPATGATFTAPASVAIQATMSAGAGVTQVDFFANDVYLGSAAGSPYSIVSSGLTAGTYSLTARAVDGAGLATVSRAVTIVVGSAAPPLPPPPASWSNQDVGTVGGRGSTGVSGATWSLTASGSDIWSTADAFQFAYQTLTGDGSITARVASLSNTNVWTKAGVMMRETLAAGSRHAFMLVTPSSEKGFAFQRRVSPNGDSAHTPAGPGAPPQWLRLTRAGDVLTGQYSADGITWTTAGSESIAMNATIYVGLALTSHDDTQLASATFDNVSVGGPTAGPASTLPAPWKSDDVGATGAAGGASVSASTWTVRGSGADVWGTADAFRYVSQPLTGDGTIIARVTALSGSHPWAKAGVMFRESLDPSSPHAFALVTPGGANGVAFQRRIVRADVSVHTPGDVVAAPVWVKLTRRGASISGSWSFDGQTWSVIGTDIVPMAATIYVGLAVTSHDAGSIATATFDNVRVTADAADTWTSQDIGPVGAGGWVAASDDSFAVTASGSDIWGTEDAFRFTYRAVSGNFDVTARVASVEAVDQWTKAGVMIRASTDSGSAHASAFATPSTVKGLAFQRRPTSGALSVHTAGPAVAPVVWIRLLRQASVISAWYRVTTSDAWIAIGSDVVELPATVLVGLGVTSHQYGELATAVFDNVSITSLP